MFTQEATPMSTTDISLRGGGSLPEEEEQDTSDDTSTDTGSQPETGDSSDETIDTSSSDQPETGDPSPGGSSDSFTEPVRDSGGFAGTDSGGGDNTPTSDSSDDSASSFDEAAQDAGLDTRSDSPAEKESGSDDLGLHSTPEEDAEERSGRYWEEGTISADVDDDNQEEEFQYVQSDQLRTQEEAKQDRAGREEDEPEPTHPFQSNTPTSDDGPSSTPPEDTEDKGVTQEVEDQTTPGGEIITNEDRGGDQRFAYTYNNDAGAGNTSQGGGGRGGGGRGGGGGRAGVGAGAGAGTGGGGAGGGRTTPRAPDQGGPPAGSGPGPGAGGGRGRGRAQAPGRAQRPTIIRRGGGGAPGRGRGRGRGQGEGGPPDIAPDNPAEAAALAADQLSKGNPAGVAGAIGLYATANPVQAAAVGAGTAGGGYLALTYLGFI